MESTAILKFIRGNAELAKKIYSTISSGSKDENILFSPISAYIVLAMAYQGAAGETAEKIANLLNVDTKTSVAVGYNGVVEQLINNIDNLTLYLANKVFVKEGLTLKEDFKTANKDLFLSEVESVNFSNRQNTAQIINQWVETKTNSKIKDLILPDSLCDSTALLLVNACYFNSDWKIVFAEEDTSTQSFFITEDQEVDCQMMQVTDCFNYTSSSDLSARILELQYVAENVCMLIILPHEITGITELERKLGECDLSQLMEEEGYKHCGEVEVSLPKFKIEASMDLKPVLKKMGLEIIFTPEVADFSEMAENSRPLYISEFRQKTFIDVNEQGTEATGASFAGMCAMSGPEIFRANHPFMYILQVRGDDANTVLFIGKVMNPGNEIADDDDDDDDDDDEEED